MVVSSPCKRTANAFPSIPLDQAHEQNNELIKGEGSVIGITENPNAHLRWISGGWTRTGKGGGRV